MRQRPNIMTIFPSLRLELKTPAAYASYVLIRIWQETGKTIVFVTHSISESVFLSQQILIVSKRPATVFKRQAIDLPYPRQYGDARLFDIKASLTRDFL
jgi:ABC-type nitrate/sulfonate/bicarbonate transport system ATPase subunit